MPKSPPPPSPVFIYNTCGAMQSIISVTENFVDIKKKYKKGQIEIPMDSVNNYIRRAFSRKKISLCKTAGKTTALHGVQNRSSVTGVCVCAIGNEGVVHVGMT